MPTSHQPQAPATPSLDEQRTSYELRPFSHSQTCPKCAGKPFTPKYCPATPTSPDPASAKLGWPLCQRRFSAEHLHWECGCGFRYFTQCADAIREKRAALDVERDARRQAFPVRLAGQDEDD